MKNKDLKKLVDGINAQFKSPLLENVSVEAELTDDGFGIQINERYVSFDNKLEVTETCTGPLPRE